MTDAIETKSEAETGGAAKAAPLLPLTVIIPVRNEAHNLRRCLESLQSVGEVYVIDSQSTDDTVAIAQSCGAQVVQFHYAGGWPKKAPVGDGYLASGLRLDLAARCRRGSHARSRGGNSKGNSRSTHQRLLHRLADAFLGRRLRHSGASFWKLSLFRKGLGRFECRLQDQNASMADMEVHEHVVVTGATRKLTHPLVHHNVESLSRYIQKHNEYSNWEARVWLEGNRNKNDEEIQPAFWGTQAQRRRWLRRHFLGLPGSPILFFSL